MIEADRLISAATASPQEEGEERALRPKHARRVRGPGEDPRAARRSSSRAARNRKRGARPRAALRPAGPGQDHARAHHRARDGREPAADLGPGARARRRPRRDPHQPRAATTCSSSTRSIACSPVVEEILYPALEDFQIDIMIGEGPAARSVKLDLPPFTLVGRHDARRHAHQPAARPLRDRRAPGVLHAGGAHAASCTARRGLLERRASTTRARVEIARRSRGTPRIANRLLRRVRDFAEVKAAGRGRPPTSPTRRCACSTSTRSASTSWTASSCSRVIEKFGGGPVGVENLAAAIGEERDTIEDVLEPFLIQQGYLQRTPRGRIATALAYRHFGLGAGAAAARRGPLPVSRIAMKPTLQPELFVYSFPVRVYFENTDAGGVVYHGEYLKFLERARTEWLRHLGLRPPGARARTTGWSFVVTAMAIDFLKPARLDDTRRGERAARVARQGALRLRAGGAARRRGAGEGAR